MRKESRQNRPLFDTPSPMDDVLLESKGPFTLKIWRESQPYNPRGMDCFGKIICFHSRYFLGDNHSYQDKNEFLKDLFLDTVGFNQRGENRYIQLESRFLPEHSDWTANRERAMNHALLDVIQQKHVILPLYLYDHSGLTLNTRGFSCSWDSGQVGWTYASKDNILNCFGGQRLTAEKRKRAEDILFQETVFYNHYLQGNCYGFELYENGVLFDGCAGFLGEWSEVCRNIEHALPLECQGITDKLVRMDGRQSVLHLLNESKEKAEQTCDNAVPSGNQQERSDFGRDR